MEKYRELRKKHPKFTYRGYEYKIFQKNLKIFFDFKLEPGISFRPELTIKNVGSSQLKKFDKEILESFIFNIGMAEIPSYWKVACSPEISVEAGSLDEGQILWWKKLFLRGMGQYFYENGIDWRKPDFLNICAESKSSFKAKSLRLDEKRYLVPMGGGKDSIVTLEKLKEEKKEIGCFVLNPIDSTMEVLKASGIREVAEVERKIDPCLLKLNEKGYLNGHIPFTALLMFVSSLCAVLFDYGKVAFSNEKSAKEGNLRYLGKEINHQYSKTEEFENDFRKYCRKHLAKDLDCFSFLRRHSELEIAEMFSRYPKYFRLFSSCNAVRKINRKGQEKWCCKCPKCLSVYLFLYPFLEKEQMKDIFGLDLFEKKELLGILRELLGKGAKKPFECVGTFKEAEKALKLSQKKAGKNLPYLLKKAE
jgi:hypothetical protein